MSVVLSQLTDSPKLTAEDEWLKINERKTIEELKDCTEVESNLHLHSVVVLICHF